MEQSVRSIVFAHPKKYLLSYIRGIIYLPVNSNTPGYLCKGVPKAFIPIAKWRIDLLTVIARLKCAFTALNPS